MLSSFLKEPPGILHPADCSDMSCCAMLLCHAVPCCALQCPKTWVNSLFSGILQSQVRCLQCGYVSNSYDPFMDLSLELTQGMAHLVQCMRHFTAAETLEGKNSYR
jgi:ubiquitin C-terminal hydrolase